MSFSFGFFESEKKASQAHELGNTTKMLPAKEHFMNIELLKVPTMNVKIGDFHVQLVQSCKQETEPDLKSILATSDIESGVYEGGFKVWECSIDLAEYMVRNQLDVSKTIELGCGHGIPGIVALRQGSKNVVFTDYNPQVIELTTMKNVLLNKAHGARFFSGDWTYVSNLMDKATLILSADTLYTEEVGVKVYEMVKAHLQYPNGVALIAAKKYYFGTGGSVHHFLNLVKQDGILLAKIVQINEDCKSNIRNIVQLSFV